MTTDEALHTARDAVVDKALTFAATERGNSLADVYEDARDALDQALADYVATANHGHVVLPSLTQDPRSMVSLADRLLADQPL